MTIRHDLGMAVAAVVALLSFEVLAATYTNTEFGFVANVPDDWTVYAERHEGDRFIVSYGLPAVWSDLEQQHIENAVSITAYRRDDIRDLSTLLEADAERVADILVSREDTESEFGRAIVRITEIRGLRYKSLVTSHFTNGIGYVIAFTATDGTYDTNLPKYAEFLPNISYVKPVAEGSGGPTADMKSSDDYYQRAREMYAEGPSRASETIGLLRKAIEADSENTMAHYLLGVTYFGTSRFEDALREFDRALELKEADGKTISAELRFYRARTLFELGQCAEAKQLLDSHWAFWQDGGRLQERYEALSPKVERACGSSKRQVD